MTEDERKAQQKAIRKAEGRPYRVDTARRVRYWRKLAGIRQYQLADKIGWSEPSVSRWENVEDDSTPSAEILSRIAEACGVSMRVFWSDLPESADNKADEVLG